jgi:hypothetical protein
MPAKRMTRKRAEEKPELRIRKENKKKRRKQQGS